MIVEQKNATLESKDIWEKFKEKVDWKPIPSRPQSIDTVEFGIKSQKQLNQTLQDIFGAKPPKRHDKGRGLVFDLDFLDKISRNYDIDVEIKVQEGDVPESDTSDASDACRTRHASKRPSYYCKLCRKC